MFGVFSGKEKSPFNLIVDENTDQSLKYGIINLLTSRSDRKIALLCYQESTKSYRKKLTTSHSLVYVDKFDDPLTWLQKNDKPPSEKGSIKSHLIQSLNKSGVTDHTSSAIFIDDVILFGRSYNLIDSNGEWDNQFLQILHQISNDIPIFVYVKSNMLSTGILKSLQYQSSFNATFIPGNHLLSKASRCEHVLRKKSGKVVAEVFGYQMDGSGKLLFKMEDDEYSVQDITTPNQEADPSSNLTFNLRLTQSERDAKAQTVLPYLLKDENKVSMLREDVNKGGVGGGMGGEIIYTPDDMDDFDDEDPDDDLDI